MQITCHNILTNYTQLRKGSKAMDSDHLPTQTNMEFKLYLYNQQELNNFKNERARKSLKIVLLKQTISKIVSIHVISARSM